MTPPTLHDVYMARERVRPHVPRSPLLRHPLLDQAAGLSIWVKHENHLPTSAFKARDGLTLSSMTPEERGRGIVTATPAITARSASLRASTA